MNAHQAVAYLSPFSFCAKLNTLRSLTSDLAEKTPIGAQLSKSDWQTGASIRSRRVLPICRRTSCHGSGSPLNGSRACFIVANNKECLQNPVQLVAEVLQTIEQIKALHFGTGGS